LRATFVLGAAFFGVKMLEYAHDYEEHLVPWLDFDFPGPHKEGARLFFLMYFVTTGAHAVHLLVGLALVAIVRRKLEVVALYWHLIDVVWIFLYPLLYLVSRT
jgi:cytochrome c oxidase subunit 3